MVGEAFATWDGGRAAALRSRASRGTRFLQLWELQKPFKHSEITQHSGGWKMDPD